MRLVALSLLVQGGLIRPAPARETDADRQEGIRLFNEAAEHHRQGEYSLACAGFESSLARYIAPRTLYNVGICALIMSGQRVRALLAFTEALRQDQIASENRLKKEETAGALRFIEDLKKQVARVRFTIEPGDADLAIDGAPLLEAPSESLPMEVAVPGRTVQVAGVVPPGQDGKTQSFQLIAGRVVVKKVDRAAPQKGTKSFELIIQGGPHLITISRRGFKDFDVPQTFTVDPAAWRGGPASPHPTIHLELLPATLKVDPIPRPAQLILRRDKMAWVYEVPTKDLPPLSPGEYTLVVKKKGFLFAPTVVKLLPGQDHYLRAVLIPKPPFYKTWWFWTTTATGLALVAGGVLLGTLYQPPLDGGNTGWVAHVQ